jgi:eukaryotic-like serine/threonine-protein kinase
MSDLIGQSLDRRYRIISLLGQGGMGAVYKGLDTMLQRDVAVKVMHSHLTQEADFKDRFRQEAQIAARLKHPGIATLYDFGIEEAQSPIFYIVMEFVPGPTLRQRLDEWRLEQQPMPLPQALQLVRSVCLTVNYLHQEGVLHRDIKPENIILKEGSQGLRREPMLTDLGLAKLIEGGLMTETGKSMGTPAYMSPEQALGQSIGPRSDVYVLGILLYELVVGQLPFRFKSITEAIRYHSQAAPSLSWPPELRPDVPEEVRQIILKALATKPEDRFSGAAAMSEALAKVELDTGRMSSDSPTIFDEEIDIIDLDQPAQPGPDSSFPSEWPTPPSIDRSEDHLSITSADGSTVEKMKLKPRMTIGSKPGNDIVLSGPEISDRHAQIKVDGENYTVTDLDSSTGTYLGGKKLLAGVSEVWAPDKVLRLGKTQLHLYQAQPKPEVENIPPDPGGGDRARKGVAIIPERTELAVEPGSEVTVSGTVLNQGRLVERFEISVVEGELAAWVVGPPPVIKLNPGMQEQFKVILKPPRSPQSQAGPHPFTIRATSQVAPDQKAEIQGVLTVAAFHQFESKLEPQSLRAGQTGQITIENQGNTPQTFTVSWKDETQKPRFEPFTKELTVNAGQTGTVEFKPIVKQPLIALKQKEHGISVEVRPAEREPQSLQAKVISTARIPIPVLLMLVLMVGCPILWCILVVVQPWD